MPLFHEQSRTELRRLYLTAWRKFRAREPLEAQVAQVIAEHREYQALMEAGEAALEAQFPPEDNADNPFLHLGQHLAIREQVATDRPTGIARVYAELARHLGSAHEAEHRMLEVLGEAMWEAQRTGQPPDKRRYFARVAQLIRVPPTGRP